MMKRVYILIFLLTAFSFPVWAETTAIPLTEHVKPFRIRIDDKYIYIGEGPEIFIYSLKEVKFIKKFGKAGEGPREFKLYPEVSPDFDVSGQELVAFSIGKLSFFSKTGKFKNEIKLMGGGTWQFYRAHTAGIFGERITRDENKIRYTSIVKYHMGPKADLKKVREVFRFKHRAQSGKPFSPISRGIYIPNFYIHEGKLYIGGEINTSAIHIFDLDGRFLSKIEPPLEKIKYTDADKKSYIDEMIGNDEYRKQYERIKDRWRFPDYFPMFQNFVVTGGRIYIQTFKRNEKDTHNEVFILDMNGNVLKRVWLPFDEYMDYTPCPYMIRNGKLYQCVDDEVEDDWKLFITDIE